MQQRITIDIDSKNTLKLFYSIATILLYKVEALIIRSTPRGYHIIVWLLKPVSNKLHFELRKKWLDDAVRIKLDKVRLRKGEPINILFTKKHDFFYKRYVYPRQ